CPPCGARCHFKTSAKPGGCAVCGMKMVPLSQVPQVGVLLYDGVEVLSSTLPLGVFSSADVARAFTLADARDPIRAGDALEMVPQFALADAPRLDVVVIPSGWGAHEDPLLLEWVARAAKDARFVLAVGLGNVVLSRAGVLGEETVAGDEFLVQRA